jgi:hypothetical protein
MPSRLASACGGRNGQTDAVIVTMTKLLYLLHVDLGAADADASEERRTVCPRLFSLSPVSRFVFRTQLSV